MSYAEYLRRKASATPVILNTKTTSDASMFTLKKRLMSSSVFRVDGSDVGSMIEGNDRSGNNHRPISYVKKTGRPADASDYTSYLGSQGIRNDSSYNRGRLVANSNSAGSISNCVAIPAPVIPKQASQITREIQNCPAVRGDAISNQVFVDNTIRLSSGLPPEQCCNGNGVARAIHDVKSSSAYPVIPNRPSQAGGQYATIGPNITRPDDARKVGAVIPSDHLPYVEKHHGNDLNVNPRRPAYKYKPGGLPAHLKINEPTHYFVA